MDIDFYKLHLCGNDAILLNYLYRTNPGNSYFSELSRKLCPRRTGIGANSLIVATQSDQAELGMEHFTPKGSEAIVDNDATLCLARFAFDSGFVNGNRIDITVGNKKNKIEVIDSESFRISLGPPRSLDGSRELSEDPDSEANLFVEVDGKRRVVTPLFVNRPFLVVVSSMRGPSVKNLTKSVRMAVPSLKALPVFLRIISREEIAVYTWQPASLQDCTSSVAAAAAAGILNGFCDNDLVVDFKGHTLFVQWMQRTNQILVTATPRYVYSGSYYLEEPD